MILLIGCKSDSPKERKSSRNEKYFILDIDKPNSKYFLLNKDDQFKCVNLTDTVFELNYFYGTVLRYSIDLSKEGKEVEVNGEYFNNSGGMDTTVKGKLFISDADSNNIRILTFAKVEYGDTAIMTEKIVDDTTGYTIRKLPKKKAGGK